MQTKFSFLIIALLLFLTACEDGAKKEIQQMHDQVMGVHDEIMPKHMELQSLQEELKSKLKELNASGAADSAAVVNYHSAIEGLDKAVKGMDDWMHNWDMKYAEKPSAEAIAYLKEQMGIISEVKKDFEEGEKMAKSLLNE
ncbi:MAG: hypothetical protein MRZ79_06630 [Bacteroidia bacterium]|nr:hypothetical protein [Bacteroidia bacterium]